MQNNMAYSIPTTMGMPSNITYTVPGNIQGMSGFNYPVPQMGSNIPYTTPGPIHNSQFNPINVVSYAANGGFPGGMQPMQSNFGNNMDQNSNFRNSMDRTSNFGNNLFPTTPQKSLYGNQTKSSFGTPTLNANNQNMGLTGTNFSFNENNVCEGKQHFQNAVNDLVNNNQQVLSQNIRHQELIDKVF